MNNTDKFIKELDNKEELEQLYQIYIRVQSGDKSALNELFKSVEVKPICKADEIYKKDRMSNMDNVLDSELILEEEKNKQEEEWLNSSDSKVMFQFSCLNKMLYKKKKKFMSKAKNTGYENGKKKQNSGHKKFYDGEYDISDFNELMYETIIEIFNKKTDENNCLTLDGKKNEENPIVDGISLLKNISYFTSRKINKRAKNSYLDVFDMGYCSEDQEAGFSSYDKYAFKKFIESDRGISRLPMYAEYLEWLKKCDIHKLFKANACDIHAIIDTIMNNNNVFIKDMSGDKEIGFGMRFVTQERLREIIKLSQNINIEQENISNDMEIIEKRLLNHLLYSLNYRIGKAEKSKGIFEKESERFLYELDEKKYIKMFSRSDYDIYEKSVSFFDSYDYKGYFKTIKEYEDMVIEIVALDKNEKNYDLVSIANIIISYYQNREEEYRKNELGDYKKKGFTDWSDKYWEAELKDKVLKIRLRSNRDVKNPIRYSISKENLIVHCGCMNFYFCDIKENVCCSVPKNKRVISKSNRNHETFIYDID